MTIQFTNYTNKPGYTADFHRVFDFLFNLDQDTLTASGMDWVRWEWCFAKELHNKKIWDNIGIWEDNGKIIASTLYDSDDPGTAWLVTDSGYKYLRKEMLDYAEKNLCYNGKFLLSINDNDRDFQLFAHEYRYRPTQYKEQGAFIELNDANLSYSLPEGYCAISVSDEFDAEKYGRAMWLGFNHPEPVPGDEKRLAFARDCVTSPHSNPDLIISVKSPEAEYVSYCGGWYIPGNDAAMIEPVATVPGYRKTGMGRAAVMEACRRCKELGAKKALVGSYQQFYYNIGFIPYGNDTFWSK